MRRDDFFSWLVLISALGLAIFLMLFSCEVGHALPWICPSARVNDQTTVLTRLPLSKPAMYSAFYDSVYSTCFERISTDTLSDGNTASVPTYSEVQAWNADQSKIWLVNGQILDGRSYQPYRIAVGIGSVNFTWSPIYPDTGYYTGGTSNRQFRGWNIRNDNTFLLHDFGATYHQGIMDQHQNPQEQHDPAPNGWIVQGGFLRSAKKDTLGIMVHATNGSATLTIPAGNAATFDSLVTGSEIYPDTSLIRLALVGFPDHTTFTVTNSTTLTASTTWSKATGDYLMFAGNSRLFGYNVLTDQVTGFVPGFSPHCSGGAEDLFASPRGDHLLVHWGTAGAQLGVDATTQNCGLVSFDTTMTYEGKVASGRTHGSVTVDSKGKEWYIAGCNGTDGPPTGGPTGVSVYKYRIPNGQDLYNAQSHVENDTTVIGLCYWNTNGIHVSGTAPGADFAVVSADHGSAASADYVFRDEIVKLYLDSRFSTPHLERLADTRSNEHAVNVSTCPISSYWAQPHASISRDGTKIIWGSTWGDSGAVCKVEAYVMDICRRPRNETLVNMTPNTWRRITAPRAYAFDGSGGGPADTVAPYRVYSSVKFAPEIGGLISWGGGSDGASQGDANDIYVFTPSDTLWRQITYPDSINKYPNATAYRLGTANQDSVVSGKYSVRDLYQVTGGMQGSVTDSSYWHVVANAIVSEFKPSTGTRNHRPWSSHIANNQMWNSRNRSFNLWGGATGLYNFKVAPDSLCPGESLFTITCTWTSGSNTLHSNHLFGSIPRSGGGVSYNVAPRSVAGMTVSGPGLSNGSGCPTCAHNHQDYSNADTTFNVNTIVDDATITMSRNANSTSQAGGEPVTFGYSTPGQSYFIYEGKGSWSYPFWNKNRTWNYADALTGTQQNAGGWAFTDTFPDLAHCCSQFQYDPVNRVGVASSWGGNALLGGGTQGFQPGWIWVIDTLGVWTRKARIPTDGHHQPYYVTSVYDRKNGKILWYPATGDTTMWEYDPASDTFNDLHPLRDGGVKPVLGDANIAYDSKDAKLLIHGWNGNNGAYNPTWVYDIASNQLTKMNPTSYNSNGSQSNAGEPDGNGVRDRDNHFDYDPTDNVFIMVRDNGHSPQAFIGSGQPAVTNGITAEVWVYKLTSGDGRLFAPVTAAAGPSCGTTSGW